jgi:hypothetical protein
MKLKTVHLVLKTDRPIGESASKLRGYIGSKFSDYPILHHHISEVGYLYTYPRVQYKILGGTPYILGIEEGAAVLREISDALRELVLNNNTYRITQRVLYDQEVVVGPSRRNQQYIFITPWLALNPANYEKYREIKEWRDKKDFLNGILVGNILSMCKGLGIVVDKHLHVHSHLDAGKVEYKNAPLMGFTGEFRVNFVIPDLFGLGKGVSQGFGVVKHAHPD